MHTIDVTCLWFSQYQSFSDRKLLPPLLKGLNIAVDVTEIELEPHIHVGGKKKFFGHCIGTDQLHLSDGAQTAKYQKFAKLEREGVFTKLQERIISDDIRLSGDGGSAKDEGARVRGGKEEGGLILWWKGHSAETLSALRVGSTS